MPRKKRVMSNTGVYHVMLRGINKQNIFIYEDDFRQMQWTLVEAQRQYGPDGRLLNSDECTIYAYCILNNHVHILLREGNKKISQIVQKIEDRFVYLYNKKYDRVGHLFQGRFRSEPVNDNEYFHTLLRYIHRNPVQAMECERPEDYLYSSWREYLPQFSNEVSVLLPRAFKTVYEYFTPSDLVEWVNMNVHDNCMDMSSERFVVTDSHAWDILSDISGEDNPQDFKCLHPDLQMEFAYEAIQSGISLRQATRLSSLTYYSIRKYAEAQRKCSELSTKGSDPLIEKCSELIDGIEGVSGNNRERMKRIVALARNNVELRGIDVAEEFGVSDSLARRLLRKMVEAGVLMVAGSTKSRTYKLSDRDDEEQN